MEEKTPQWWLDAVNAEMSRRGWIQADLARHLIGMSEPEDPNVPKERENDFKAAKKRVSQALNPDIEDKTEELIDEISRALGVANYRKTMGETEARVNAAIAEYVALDGPAKPLEDAIKAVTDAYRAAVDGLRKPPSSR